MDIAISIDSKGHGNGHEPAIFVREKEQSRMGAELRQTESLSNLLEAIDRWETVAATLQSEGLKLMVAEHTEFLKHQLERFVLTLPDQETL